RSETVDPHRLLAHAPELIERGQRLLAHINDLLGAADALHDQSRWLRSDLLSQSTVDWQPDSSSGMEPVPDPFPGEFRVSRRLGEGAFGTVWLAEDLHLGRPVALKTVRLGRSSPTSGRLLAALRDEARLLASVRHRHVTQVYAWRDTVVPTGGSND